MKASFVIKDYLWPNLSLILCQCHGFHSYLWPPSHSTGFMCLGVSFCQLLYFSISHWNLVVSFANVSTWHHRCFVPACNNYNYSNSSQLNALNTSQGAAYIHVCPDSFMWRRLIIKGIYVSIRLLITGHKVENMYANVCMVNGLVFIYYYSALTEHSKQYKRFHLIKHIHTTAFFPQIQRELV